MFNHHNVYSNNYLKPKSSGKYSRWKNVETITTYYDNGQDTANGSKQIMSYMDFTKSIMNQEQKKQSENIEIMKFLKSILLGMKMDN